MSKTIFRKNLQKKFRIALLTGGPSLERGISLNSSRSVLDHLGSENIEIVPIYFDQKKRAYKISRAELYSNNPSDFDFKLAQKFSPLSEKSLVKLLKSVDIVMPAMHGSFGEDGQIQSFLEKKEISFIGSGSNACKIAFDKYKANQTLNEKGFFTLPSSLIESELYFFQADGYPSNFGAFCRGQRIYRHNFAKQIGLAGCINSFRN